MIEQANRPQAGVRQPAVCGGTTADKVDPRRPVVRRDGGAIVIDIPMTFRRRSGRKEIVLPEGATAAPPKPTGPLALALARAFRWQEMIESGEAVSNSDLARRLKLDPSFVARTIRLAALAPDIVEAILGGHEPDGLSLGHLRKEIPLLWEDQHEVYPNTSFLSSGQSIGSAHCRAMVSSSGTSATVRASCAT
ncbi:MAG: hypothetical protein IMZ55_06125 [Acidobacteria bacterium]|nr:hypothetical protein [Acidobacteriota bacterium]